MKYTQEMIQYMNLFENVTHTKIKDCIIGEIITFIVEPGYIGKAIGKNGSNIKAVERLIKKKIRLIEFSSDVLQFTKNIIPIKAKDIYMENNVLNISTNGIKDKGLLIGRNRKNLDELKFIVLKYFKIGSIKVL